MKKTFITTSILTLLVSSVFAQDWQYTTSDGGGYSYDANGVYTDNRGFTVFDGLTLDNVNYSNVQWHTNANNDNKSLPISSKDYYKSSFISIYNTSITNSNFSNGTYTGDIQQYNGGASYDTSSLYLSKNSTLKNVDFSNSTFSISVDETTARIGGGQTSPNLFLDGTVENVSFKNSTFSNVPRANPMAVNIKMTGNISGLDLSYCTFKGSDMTNGRSYMGISIGENSVVSNLNISNSVISGYNSAIEINGTLNGINAQNTVFKDLQILKGTDVGDLTIAIDSFGNSFSYADFRGATVQAYDSNDITSFAANNMLNFGTNGIKNIILGDGTISSFAEGDYDCKTNLGLVLSEGETFTIAKYEPKDGATTFSLSDSGISAKLTTNSTINGGTIIFEDGETLQLSDGVKLEVSGDTVIDNGTIIFGENASITVSENSELVIVDGTEFVLSEGATVDSVLSTETGSTIVMAGYETDEEAQQAFGNMFVDESGNVLTFDTSNYNVIGGTAIPEPSTYAVIFGSLALGFVAYCRRK